MKWLSACCWEGDDDLRKKDETMNCAEDYFDSEGRKIPDNEGPEDEILVWVIEPGLGEHDETWVRDYNLALQAAHESLDARVDDAEKGDLLESPVSVSMRLIKTTVSRYREVCYEEPRE
jgi:hypothetical protein